MKVAEVYWTGRGGRHSRRGPSDKRYRWVSTTSDVDNVPEIVEDVEDAIYFESQSVFEVEWTALGRLAKKAEGPASEAATALSQMGYRQKQKLAKSLGIKADGTEDELEERLKPEVERLKEHMEQ